MDECYDENTLSRAQIYRIIKEVKDGKDVTDKRGHNTPQQVRTAKLIADVAAALEEDGRVTVWELALDNDVSLCTYHS